MKTPSIESLVPNQISINYTRMNFNQMVYVKNSDDAYNLVKEHFKSFIDLDEQIWMITLTSANRVLGLSALSFGSSRFCIFPIRKALQISLLSNASHVILVHNHPSGNLEPSKSDYKLTKEFKTALQQIDIQLLDHLILSSENFLSLADNGHV